MGAYRSKPITKKETEEGNGNQLEYGASCMQGWRISQEDAHNCVTDLDKNSSLFAVYDGHGGAEVAIYLSRHFPDFFKKTEAYQRGDWQAALLESYLKIDAQIKSPETIVEIQKIAKQEDGYEDGKTADDPEENVGQLYEEATMPIEALLAKYSFAAKATGSLASKDDELPGSSKSLAQTSAGSSSGSGSSRASAIKKDISEVGELMSSTSSGEGGSNSTSNEPECSSSSRPSSCPAKIEESAEAESASRSDDPPTLPAYPSQSSNSLDGEPSSSTNEVDCDKSLLESKIARPLTVVANGVVENVEPDSTEGGEAERVLVNGKEIKANGDAEVVADSTQADSSNIKIATESPKRKGKVHPPPVVIPQPTRSSPRKRSNDTQVYNDFINEDSASSDSDEDANVAPFVHESDSDDDDEDVGELANSSSSEDDEDSDEEEDEDEDDDMECDDEKRIMSEMQEPGYDSGATAVVAFLQWNEAGDKLNLWVANAGDSRCVVSRSGVAIEMSHDHKPEDEIESRRIVNAGGKVTGDGRVNGGLNLSRALGDHSYKQNSALPPEEQMITPLPDIRHEILEPQTDEFIILACDGVWNSMNSQQVVDFVLVRLKEGVTVSQICEQLFDACLAADTTGDGAGCDNMTAVIVKLPNVTLKKVEGSLVSDSNDQNKRRLSTSEADVEDSKRLKIGS